MAGEVQDNVWPLPKFHFKVEFDGLGVIQCQEVSGLDTEYDVIEYRVGDAQQFSTIKMPGLRKASDVTLKKGMFVTDTKLFDYFMEVQMNTILRQTVTIQLLDESHEAVLQWTLANAFPLKVTGTDLNAQSSEVAVEEIVLAHEGLTFGTPT